MDKLKRQLQKDADLIKADVSAELQERIRASVESTRPIFEKPRKTQTPGTTLWWASSLTGLAAVGLIIVLVNLNSTTEPVRSQPPSPTPVWDFPLRVETAEWATPLEEELKNLQSDLEKARENVERDLRRSF